MKIAMEDLEYCLNEDVQAAPLAASAEELPSLLGQFKG
jgi:hypothetical protein